MDFYCFKLAIKSTPDLICLCPLGDNREQMVEENRHHQNWMIDWKATRKELFIKRLLREWIGHWLWDPPALSSVGSYSSTHMYFSSCHTHTTEEAQDSKLSSFHHTSPVETLLDPRLKARVWQRRGVSLGFFDFKTTAGKRLCRVGYLWLDDWWSYSAALCRGPRPGLRAATSALCVTSEQAQPSIS